MGLLDNLIAKNVTIEPPVAEEVIEEKKKPAARPTPRKNTGITEVKKSVKEIKSSLETIHDDINNISKTMKVQTSPIIELENDNILDIKKDLVQKRFDQRESYLRYLNFFGKAHTRDISVYFDIREDIVDRQMRLFENKQSYVKGKNRIWSLTENGESYIKDLEKRLELPEESKESITIPKRQASKIARDIDAFWSEEKKMILKILSEQKEAMRRSKLLNEYGFTDKLVYGAFNTLKANNMIKYVSESPIRIALTPNGKYIVAMLEEFRNNEKENAQSWYYYNHANKSKEFLFLIYHYALRKGKFKTKDVIVDLFGLDSKHPDINRCRDKLKLTYRTLKRHRLINQVESRTYKATKIDEKTLDSRFEKRLDRALKKKMPYKDPEIKEYFKDIN